MSSSPTKRTRFFIRSPDDLHLHIRDGHEMHSVLPFVLQRFARAIIMPNLKGQPVRTAQQAKQYKNRIQQAIQHIIHDEEKHQHQHQHQHQHKRQQEHQQEHQQGQEAKQGSELARFHSGFEPLMTIYLTDETSEDDIIEAKKSGIIYAAKLYPRGATTNSNSGVSNIRKIKPALEAMARHQILLLVHAEVTDQSVDIFMRENEFVKQYLEPIVNDPDLKHLKVVMEHITTKSSVEFVKKCGKNVAATITAHHLLYNRNVLFKGGISPHFYCLPILKTEEDRLALVEAATSGNPKFFLGTDSAPHSVKSKECCCGAAGIFTSHAAVELYFEVFVAAQLPSKTKSKSKSKSPSPSKSKSNTAMNKPIEAFEAFSSENGATFYGIPLNTSQICIEEREQQVPATFQFGENEQVRPLRAGESTRFTVVGVRNAAVSKSPKALKASKSPKSSS